MAPTTSNADGRGALSVEEALTKPVEDMVINGRHDAAASASTSHKGSGSNSNEHKDANAEEEPSSWPAEDDDEEKAGAQGQSVEALHAELERTREERDSFEGQYKGLLGKLTQMRSTLGDRLRQDAVSVSACPPFVRQCMLKVGRGTRKSWTRENSRSIA